MIWDRCGPEVLPVRGGGVPGTGVIGEGVGCLCWSGAGAPVPLHVQCVWGIFEVPFWQGWQPDMWFWRSIASCLSILALTFWCPGNWIDRFISCWILAQGLLMMYSVFWIAAYKISSLALLAIFKARRMSDCSSCTQPACVAVVADMFKTYKKLVAASNKVIPLLPLPYMLP